MDVSALKKQSPFATATDTASTANASDEFLAVFRKHVTGDRRAAIGGLADPSKALFSAERDLPEPVQTQPQKPEAAAAPERPRERQRSSEAKDRDSESTTQQAAPEAPQQPAAKPRRNEQKDTNADAATEDTAVATVETKSAEVTAAPVIATLLPAEPARQAAPTLAPATAQATPGQSEQAPMAPEAPAQEAGQPTLPVPQRVAMTDAGEAQPAQAAQAAPVLAAAAAPAAQRQKITMQAGNENWLEEPIQVTTAEAVDKPIVETSAAGRNIQNLMAAIAADQEESAADGTFALDLSQPRPTTGNGGGQPATAPQPDAADAALDAQMKADAAARNVVVPVLAGATPDAATVNAAGRGAVDAPTQIGAAGGAQGTADASKAKAPAPPPPARPVPPKELVPEIKAQVVKAMADGVDRINIQMRPAQLGKIEIRLEIAQDGQLTASFTAENKDTLQMLQRDARELHKGFQEAGLQTDSSSLTFNLRGGQGEHQNANGQQRSAQRGLGGGEMPIEDQVQPENVSSRASGVDISV